MLLRFAKFRRTVRDFAFSALGHSRLVFIIHPANLASKRVTTVMGMNENLPTMSTDQALAMLAENGNFMKRPFALDESAGVHLVGFKDAEWEAALKP